MGTPSNRDSAEAHAESGVDTAACNHRWDTETDEFSTFTPDPQLDEPWVIHECCEVGCYALKIERPIFGQGRKTLVYEVVR